MNSLDQQETAPNFGGSQLKLKEQNNFELINVQTTNNSYINPDPFGPTDSIHEPIVYQNVGEIKPETDEDKTPTANQQNEGGETDKNQKPVNKVKERESRQP